MNGSVLQGSSIVLKFSFYLCGFAGGTKMSWNSTCENNGYLVLAGHGHINVEFPRGMSFYAAKKSPNILLPILGLSHHNGNNKLSDYSIFL